MVGAWAGAVIAVAGAIRIGWHAFVKAVESVIEGSIGRVWRDMDDIERRLDRLETSLEDLREQVRKLSDLLMAHVTEMTRRHERG